MFRSHLCLLSILAALALPIKVVAQVNVLVTIKPLQLIAETIVGGVGTISTLLPAGNSPHHYNLSPSDRIAIEAADLIIYVGEELETQFDSVMDQLGSKKNILELLPLQSLERHSLTTEMASATGIENIRYDPHIWLNTGNATKIAEAIRNRLTLLDKARAGEFAENFNRFNNRLNELQSLLHQKLETADPGPYVVYHNAFRYFEKQFELSHRLAFVEDPEIQPGMRQILKVREAITNFEPVCLFTDDSASQATINTMLSGYQINSVQLDLLGKRLGEAEGYEQLMENLVDDFTNCF